MLTESHTTLSTTTATANPNANRRLSCDFTVSLNGYYSQGLATSCCARCTLIDSLVVKRALNFTPDGHFLAAVIWDINHSRLNNGVCIGHRKMCTSALHVITVALPSHRALLFYSLGILWLRTCRCVELQCRISKDDCVFEADAACLEVNSLIQETRFNVSSTKNGAG